MIFDNIMIELLEDVELSRKQKINIDHSDLDIDGKGVTMGLLRRTQ